VFTVETRTVAGAVTAVGSAGPFTLVVDRPVEAGGGGKGFNGGQLLYLAVAGCISNDLFREAPALGVELESVRISVDGDFAGEPAVSGPIRYHVEVTSSSDPALVRELVEQVDRIAEIPNSLRQGTPVELGEIRIGGVPQS
jgi:uncharacterized OsmC-like protein